MEIRYVPTSCIALAASQVPPDTQLCSADLKSEGQLEVGNLRNAVLIGTSGSQFPDQDGDVHLRTALGERSHGVAYRHIAGKSSVDVALFVASTRPSMDPGSPQVPDT